MDESAIEGLKLVESNDASADIREPSTFSIEGFDTSRQSCLVGLEVEKHFASCGQFLHIRFILDPQGRINSSVAYMVIFGEGAEEKALALDGSDVGGWTAIVKAVPSNIMTTLGPRYRLKDKRVVVSGFDTSPPEIDIQMALCEHFSSCGVVTNVMVFHACGIAYVDIQGQGCVGKALGLSGSIMGETPLVVGVDDPVIDSQPRYIKSARRKSSYRAPTLFMPARFLAEGKKQTEMEKKEKEKEKEKELKMKMKMGKKMKMRMRMEKKKMEKKMKMKMKKKEMEMEMEMEMEKKMEMETLS